MCHRCILTVTVYVHNREIVSQMLHENTGTEQEGMSQMHSEYMGSYQGDGVTDVL